MRDNERRRGRKTEINKEGKKQNRKPEIKK
jgi:hypothetical protein